MGMKRDGAREALSQEVLWNEVDYIPEVLNARQRKRGGWANASAAIPAGGTVSSGLVAEYSNGQSNLVHLSGGQIYEIESATSLESIGNPGFTSRSAVFYNDLAIFADANGLIAPVKVQRLTPGNHTQMPLVGSPPAGKFLLVYKDVVWNMSRAANPKRIFFSVAGNPESWDLTTKFLDNSYPITGAAALQNVVLVFAFGRTTRIRGSIPPPDSDFQVDDPFFEVGCTDNRSIANYRDRVVFANAQGLYITDGSALEDLTRICGMKTWWRDVMLGQEGFSTGARYNPATWTIAGGVYGDYYFYSMHNGVTLVDSGMIDLTSFTWHRQDNLLASVYYARTYPEELFFGRRDTARMGQISDIFQPGASNASDGNGVAVEPYFETGFVEDQPGTRTNRRVYLGYDLRDSLSNNPTLEVGYITSPEQTAYTALAPTFGTVAEYTRDYRGLHFPSKGIAFRVRQVGASDDTRIYGIELDAQMRERHR